MKIPEEVERFKQLIEEADSILVISHISPDPDSICSLLLMGEALIRNFPHKTVAMNAEELTDGLEFLAGYDKLTTMNLTEAVSEIKPDLIIITDAMNFQRCTRGEAEVVRQAVKSRGVKVAIVDHHEPEAVESNSSYINRRAPAATEEVYKTLFEDLGLIKPQGSAVTTLLGIVADTNRFMYDNPQHSETFRVVAELLDEGASIEKLENMRTRYTKNQMLVLAELAVNSAIEQEYSYSFISDTFKNEWFATGKTADELKLGCQIFVNDYIRNLGDNLWGFLVYPDLLGGPNTYSASFRSVSGVKDVSQLAKKLGGGGHKASAGAKFTAHSIDEAIELVKHAITQS